MNFIDKSSVKFFILLQALTLAFGMMKGQSDSLELHLAYQGLENGMHWYGIHVDGSPGDLQHLTEIKFSVANSGGSSDRPEVILNGWFGDSTNTTVHTQYSQESQWWDIHIIRDSSPLDPMGEQIGILGVVDNIEARGQGPVEITHVSFELSSVLEMEVFPNPAASTVHLDFPPVSGQAQILDAMGNLIWSQELTGSEVGGSASLDVSQWTPGIYHLILKTEHQTSVTQLVVAPQ